MRLHFRKRRRFLHGVLLTLTLFSLAFFVYAFSRFAAFRVFGVDLSSHEVIILFASVVVAVLFYKPLDALILILFKEVLFRSSSRDFSMLTRLARSLRSILNQAEIANVIVNTFGETWGLRYASVLVRDKTKGDYRVVSAFRIKPSQWKHTVFKQEQPFVQLLLNHMQPLEQERVNRSFSWQEANQLNHDFERLYAKCVIPMISDGELVGAINLMPKKMARRFSQGELKSLSDFAQEAATAFQNAARFEALERSNDELMRIQSELLYSAQHSAIEQLAVGIAHEIHNPLTIISGKAQVLLLKKDKIHFDVQVEDVLKTIVKQTKRAADITRKLLMFSDAKKSVEELIDFEALVNDCIALLSYQVSLDEIQVAKRFTQPLPKWYGNVAALREAFLNLFLNAVQAIGKQGIIEVVVRVEGDPEAIEIRIADSGVGVAEENLPRVFQPFFTTRDKASGLGLFVTRQIIQGYAGSIRAEHRPGGGTVFVIELPCERRADPSKEGKAKQEAGTAQKTYSLKKA